MAERHPGGRRQRPRPGLPLHPPHAFRWRAGGVRVNYHSLSDFRVQHLEFLDDLLTHSVAVWREQELVDRNRVAQDGRRVRASAGAASFRRRPTREECWTEATEPVQRLRAEREEDPGAGPRRQQQAQERAARQRQERLRPALERLPEREAKKKADAKTKARGWSTDPEATVRKRADGGCRPAYHFPFATATARQLLGGVEGTTNGADQGELAPRVEPVHERCGQRPKEALVEGGFASHADREAVSAPDKGGGGYAPVPEPKDPKRDRYPPREGDGPAVAAWRVRRGTEQAQALDKDRAASAACVNALARNRGWRQLTGRGRLKAKAIARWYALAPNLRRAVRLRAALVAQG